MISSASALLASTPGAFQALGVGSVAFIGILVPTLAFERVGFSPESLGLLTGSTVPEHEKFAYLTILAFAAFFFIYSMGLGFIQAGTFLRWKIFGSLDRKTVVLVAKSNNEFLQKILLETRTHTSILDGMSMAILVFMVGSGSSLAAFTHWVFAPVAIAAGIAAFYSFLKMADLIIKSTQQIIEISTS